MLKSVKSCGWNKTVVHMGDLIISMAIYKPSIEKQYRSGPADAGIRCGILFRYYASVNNQGIK